MLISRILERIAQNFIFISLLSIVFHFSIIFLLSFLDEVPPLSNYEKNRPLQVKITRKPSIKSMRKKNIDVKKTKKKEQTKIETSRENVFADKNRIIIKNLFLKDNETPIYEKDMHKQ